MGAIVVSEGALAASTGASLTAATATEATSVAASPLSRQDPWALGLGSEKQKGANSSSADGDGDDEKEEAYMPAHLAELLVRDGVPKQAAGPQSF